MKLCQKVKHISPKPIPHLPKYPPSQEEDTSIWLNQQFHSHFASSTVVMEGLGFTALWVANRAMVFQTSCPCRIQGAMSERLETCPTSCPCRILAARLHQLQSVPLRVLARHLLRELGLSTVLAQVEALGSLPHQMWPLRWQLRRQPGVAEDEAGGDEGGHAGGVAQHQRPRMGSVQAPCKYFLEQAPAVIWQRPVFLLWPCGTMAA